MDTRALVEKAQSGDREALEELMAGHRPELGASRKPSRASRRGDSLGVLRFSYSALFVLVLHLLLPLPAAALVISEIHYHPRASLDPNESLEFVEIFNDTSTVVDISGYSFSEGIQFTFPEGTFLRRNSYLVVCADVDHVRQHYGIENAVGNFRGRLNNAGERLRLVNRVGAMVAEIRYRDQEEWPTAADGTGHTLSLKRVLPDPRSPGAWSQSGQPGGTPGLENFPPPLPVDKEVFPEFGAELLWRYRKGWNEETQVIEEFSDPPEAWRSAEFDDTGWPTGRAPIGHGFDEVITSLDDMRGNYLAFAARCWFVLTAEEVEEAAFFVLRLRIDDGCVVYLNGDEVGRANVGEDPGVTVPADAPAIRHAQRNLVEFEIPKERFQSGENLLAIQAHTNQLQTRYAGFSVALIHRTFIRFPPPPSPSLVLNEVVSHASEADRAVELFNLTGMSLPLEGYRLAPHPEGARAYTLPAGSRIEPRAFYSIPESALGFSLAETTVSLFLFRPEEAGLEDAVKIENPPKFPLENQSHARFPDGSPSWWISTAPTTGAANQVPLEEGLVINEIHYHPHSLDADGRPLPLSEPAEFLELHNRSARTVSLNGFAFTSGYNYAFGPNDEIAPGGYLVLARHPEAIAALYDLPAAQVLGPPTMASAAELEAFGRLSNRGECIRLEDPLRNPLEEVCYADGGDWSDKADGGGSSLELIDPRQDNAPALAWGPSDESEKAPWVEISYEAEYPLALGPGSFDHDLQILLLNDGECLIDAVSLTVGEPPKEYVPNGGFEEAECNNLPRRDCRDLGETAPWRLWGNHIHSVRTTEEAWEGAASLHLVATGSGDDKVNRIEVDGIEKIPPGTVRIRLWARWLSGSNALHISGHNNAVGRTVFLPVPEATGSPGRENGLTRRLRETAGSANLGPVISRVSHSPAVPREDENIEFRATISDADGVAEAWVHYQVDGGEEFQPVKLLEVGPSASDPTGDSYTTTVPGATNGTLLNFFLEAKDAVGNVGRYPRDAPEELLSFIVDEPMEGTCRFRVVMNRDNFRILSRRFLASNDLLPATLILEESEIYYNVGLRYRGSPGHVGRVRREQLRLKFHGEKPYLGGIKRLNLNSPGGRIGANHGRQRERMVYHLLERMAVPEAHVPYSPQWQYVPEVYWNDSLHATFMAAVGTSDSDYVRFHWPKDSDGHLWKITPKYGFDDQALTSTPLLARLGAFREGPYPGADSPENYRFFFRPKLRRSEDSFDDLIRLLTTMDAQVTPDEKYLEEIETILHIESSLRVLAVRIVSDDWDTVDVGNGHNAYLYYAPLEGRHYLVPWDADNTFGTLASSGGPEARILPQSIDHGFGRLVEVPKYRRLYARIIKELLDGPFTEEHAREWTRLVEETGEESLSDSDMISFFSKRRDFVINNFLASAVDVSFAVTTPDPAAVTSSTAVIRGMAPLEVTQFLVGVNGSGFARVEPVWSAPDDGSTTVPTEWEIEVSGLAADENEVSVLAFDRAGDTVGAAKIRVVNTTGSARFQRGDVDLDRDVDLEDVIRLLSYLFQRGELSCLDAADVNDDGAINLIDGLALLRYLYTQGPSPPEPFETVGPDPTVDRLGCGTSL
jgi:hypothetical protein